jgi:hypothetical protein
MKKIILIIFLFLSGFFITLFYLNRSGGGLAESPKTVVAPTPQLPPPVTNKKITYSGFSAPSFPTIIPLIKVDGGFNAKSVAQKVSNSLGFVSEPAVITGTRGNFLVWRQDNASLTYAPDTNSLVYSSGNGPKEILTQPTGAYQAKAEKFILQNIPLLSKDFMKFASFEYFAPGKNGGNPVYQPQKATVIQINFLMVVNDFPLYNKSLSFKPSVFIQLNSDLQVITCSVTLMPKVTLTDKFLSVITLDQAIKRLNSSEGSLINYKWGVVGNEPEIIPEVPENIKINKTELAYYYNSDDEYVLPVFIFTGFGFLNGTNSIYTTTVVSAQ